ncbi:MAG: sulfatase [Planctomycetaceae bacterium]|nr:sulfatase [Planctomycetaceae bacterium]
MNFSRLMCITSFFLTLPAIAADQPNILYIMSDDHAAHAISAYQGRLAEIAPTPHLDRLANEGALFTNAFCTNSICSPSRACVITGQYNHTNGVFDLGGRIQPDRQMLPLQMQDAGYETAMIGKWHLKAEPAAFDYYCVLPGQGKYHDPEFRIRGTKPWGKNTIAFEDKHVTDVITDLSIEWLEHKRNKSKPFFLMHHYKAPHDYFDNAPRYESYLADIDIPSPASLWKMNPHFGSLATRGDRDELVPHIGTSIGGRNPRRSYLSDLPSRYPDEFPINFDPNDYSDDENKKFAYNAYLKKFLRCVKGIDDNIGRLLQKLEALGQLDNTIIVYTADQGFMLGEHDYQDKRWMYEQSQRMPLMIRYPKRVKPGQRFDTLVENVDFAPTLLEYAGATIPSTIQGRSFRSLLETGREPDSWKKETYYRYWMHMAHHDNPAHVGIRTKTHKLIFYYGCNYDGGYRTPPGWELYDLASDPAETINLYDNPENTDLVADLKARLATLRQRIGDDGTHYPECEQILQEYWDYDTSSRGKAIQISHEFLARRLGELARGDRTPKTYVGTDHQ